MNEYTYRQMDEALRRIGSCLLDRERRCLARLGRGLTAENCDARHSDQYYNKVEYNLWAGHESEGKTVEYPHFAEYQRGSGGELNDTNTPAKMKSIRSSSAMTYNLLGNKKIRLVHGNDRFSEGNYAIEYEKQLFTLRENLQPANLDAYLYLEEKQEAIFCEMKMMEWVFNSPRGLKNKYLEREQYFTGANSINAEGRIFREAAALLQERMPSFIDTIGYEPMEDEGKPVLNSKGKPRRKAIKGEVKRFFRYDAWQMFKHSLGIYNMTSEANRQEVQKIAERSSTNALNIMLPDLKKVTLVNVVFEPSSSVIDETVRKEYENILRLEHHDFDLFCEAMREAGVMEAFKIDCGVDYDIRYMSTSEFMRMFDLQGRDDYLERYRLG